MTRELILLIAGQSLLHACMAGTRMAAPLQALRQGYSEAAVGVLIALFALTQVFLAIPSGRYADRHGLKRPLRFCVVASVIGAGLAAIWPTFPVLCVSALLVGGATGSSVIALQRHAGRAAQNPKQLKQVFSWLAIGPAFSNFFGPFTAGLMIDGVGFRSAFLLMALLPLVTWFAMRRVTELPPVIAPHGERRPRAWDLVKEPMFRRVLIVNWFLSSCWDVHTFVVPVLGHERGFSASVIGTLLGAFAIAAAAIRVVLPMIAGFLREWALIFGAMVTTGVLLAIYPLMQTPLAMGLCSVMLGIALGCVQPMVMSMLHQITPEHRHGEAVGLRMMVIQASSVSMPLLFGVAGTVVGVAGVFWSVAVWVTAGSRFAWLLRDDKRS